MKISADFTTITGPMKPMHGVGQGPMGNLEEDMMHYLKEAGVPSVRLHDVQGPMGSGLYVDIPNLFPNFDADENDPASYEFTFTDEYLKAVLKQNSDPFFRLGVTIENNARVKAFRIFPPKDFAKWARICEHVIRHYLEGWANGYHWDIKYWEVWNEPDNSYLPPDVYCDQMWQGTPEQYFEMYAVTAKHLKQCFGDKIKVGGYAACGFYDNAKLDPDCVGFPGQPKTHAESFIKFAHNFFQYISKEHAPLDFFSWHTYGMPESALANSIYCRRMLKKYGYENVEDILNEWNTCPDAIKRSTDDAAARVFAMMLIMQKSETYMLHYYDARGYSSCIFGGIFNPDTHTPYRAYYALRMFNDAYKLKNEVKSDSEDNMMMPVVAAADDKTAVLLVANRQEKKIELEFDLKGADLAKAAVIMTNFEYWYTDTAMEIIDNKLVIPPFTCLELRMPR